MDYDCFINEAIARGSRDGVASLNADQRLVFLVSEAEVNCDMNGIDTFIDRYAPDWIAETASAFERIGANAIATEFQKFMSNTIDPDAIQERLNTLIADRTGYDYDSIVDVLKQSVLRMLMPECDRLTGLLNRHQCVKNFQGLSSSQAEFGIVLLDIDNFILFNDEYGHQEGDEKLKQIAASICQVAPSNAQVFRVGGEEFLLFVPGCSMSDVVTSALQVKEAASQVFSTVPKRKSSYFFPDRSCLWLESEPSVSCGIAFYPHHGNNLESLIAAADRAMYLSGKRLRPDGVLAIAEFA